MTAKKLVTIQKGSGLRKEERTMEANYIRAGSGLSRPRHEAGQAASVADLLQIGYEQGDQSGPS